MNLFRGYHANIEAIPESGMNSVNMVSAWPSILCVFLIGYALMSLCFLALVGPCTIVVPEEKQRQRIHLVALLYQDQRMLEANTLKLVKTLDDVADLDAPLATSAVCPIGNKKGKLSMTEAASSYRVQAPIDKCPPMSRRTCSFEGEKSNERWKTLLS
jgi:hypothetical protein